MPPTPVPTSATSTSSSITVLPATLTNIPQLSDIHLRAWLTNSLYSTIYYSGYTQTLLDANITRHTNVLESDPSCRYLKATLSTSDFASPQIVGFAKINIFTDLSAVSSRKDTSERIWPPGINLLLVSLFWGSLQRIRATYGPKLGPHVQIDLVATDPSYMRRGIGKAMMKSICSIADSEDPPLPCFLEGSPEGAGLYGSVGFEAVDSFWVDLGRFAGGGDRGERWRGDAKEGKGEGWYRQVIMVRPARGTRVKDYIDI